MAVSSLRSPLAAALGVLALTASGVAALAQTSTYYTPPKIVKQGASTSPVVGTGSVQLKVFVRKDGSVSTVQVEKSTNHGDDAAATEIAKTSTYKAGMRDGKPIDAYYTLALKFSGGAVVNDTGTSSNDLIQVNALIRANKFADAKTEAQAYLAAHPSDKSAEALLGVADSYLNDSAGAAAAFDAAGTIPENFRTVAAKAYSDAAVDALKAKNNDQAIAYSQKALALQQNVNTLFIEGTAYGNAQRYPEAIAALEKARAQATAGHADAQTLNAIDTSLATSYIFGGQTDKGIALANAIKQRDPSNTRVDDTLASYYNQRAVAAMQAGKRDEAVADLEAAAKAVPSKAALMYVQASNVLAQGTTPDWKRVKAEADKALAIDPNDARANYVAGIALANSNDGKGAIPFLQKAKANAGSDASLSNDINTALTKLGVKQ
jgi:tetratricopeptide (TPR) repeat protein